MARSAALSRFCIPASAGMTRRQSRAEARADASLEPQADGVPCPTPEASARHVSECEQRIVDHCLDVKADLHYTDTLALGHRCD